MSVLVLLRLAIAAIVFLIAWFNGPGLIRLWGRFERIYLERLHLALDAIYSRTNPKTFFYTHVAVIVVLFLLVSMVVGAFNGFVVGILAGLVPSVMLSRARRQRREKIEDQLPDALVSMANSLRAGLTLPQSMGILTDNTSPPISEEFALLLKEHRLGLTLDEAMTNMSERVASKNLDLVITSIQVARIAGGNLSQVFEDRSTRSKDLFDDGPGKDASLGARQSSHRHGLPDLQGRPEDDLSALGRPLRLGDLVLRGGIRDRWGVLYP
jgi:tight adherence protein B